MSRDAYLAATRGGTDRAAARDFSDRAQRSYSSQQNNRTGQSGGSYGGGEREARVPYGGNIPPKSESEKYFSNKSNFIDPNTGKFNPYLQAAKSMSAQGQIGGGIGGGLFTTTPVIYDDSFYTDEGLKEVQEKGWSDKLSQFGKDNILNDYGDPANVGGYSYDLPEGMFYSSNIPGGGYIDNRPITYYGGGGGGGGYGGYGRGGGGGSGGGGGYSFNEFAQQGIQQAPGVNPGTLQETVSQGFLRGMGAPRFSRGGIVSLLRLGE
jgi:hypothetical protein